MSGIHPPFSKPNRTGVVRVARSVIEKRVNVSGSVNAGRSIGAGKNIVDGKKAADSAVIDDVARYAPSSSR
jgi:hypothetical protein